MKRLPIIMLCAALVVGALMIGLALLDRASGPPLAAKPTPTIEPLETVRFIAAQAIEKSLKETGCPNCSAYASGTTLKIDHPQLAPRTVAAELLGNAKTKAALKKAGFKRLSVDQGGGAFAYEIK